MTQYHHLQLYSGLSLPLLDLGGLYHPPATQGDLIRASNKQQYVPYQLSFSLYEMSRLVILSPPAMYTHTLPADRVSISLPNLMYFHQIPFITQLFAIGIFCRRI